MINNIFEEEKTMNTNNIIIRLEKREEYREVENLVRESFGMYTVLDAWSIMC